MDDRNGRLCIDWIWDNDSEDGWEPVGALNYWQTYAVGGVKTLCIQM